MLKSELSANILVIRLSSLGDVVLTGPVYTCLKAHWPDCRVTVLVKPQFASALEGHPGVDEVMAFRGLLKTARAIKASRFSHVLDLHGNLRSKILRWASGAPQQSVYRKQTFARRFFVAFGMNSPALRRHVVDRYLSALQAWDIPFPLDSGSSRNIVVMQTSFLGDSLLTLPLIRRIKLNFPKSRISVLALPKNADAFRGAEGVDDVILDDKRVKNRGIFGLWKMARTLHALNFDVAVIPHRSFRSALIARLAGIAQRVGFASSAGRFLLTDSVPFEWQSHDIVRNLSLARPLGVADPASDQESRYVVVPPLSPALAQKLACAGVAPGARVAGVHPGAAWATKRWLPQRFAELCRMLREQGIVPVLVGGPEDAELGQKISAECGAINFVGQTSLGELKALMGRFSLFISNDSGPMHLAAGAGVPVVAIFGATTRELGFFPYGPGHRVVETSLACRPCGLHGGQRCPEGHFLCMRLLSVAQVYSACLQALS